MTLERHKDSLIGTATETKQASRLETNALNS